MEIKQFLRKENKNKLTMYAFYNIAVVLTADNLFHNSKLINSKNTMITLNNWH